MIRHGRMRSRPGGRRSSGTTGCRRSRPKQAGSGIRPGGGQPDQPHQPAAPLDELDAVRPGLLELLPPLLPLGQRLLRHRLLPDPASARERSFPAALGEVARPAVSYPGSGSASAFASRSACRLRRLCSTSARALQRRQSRRPRGNRSTGFVSPQTRQVFAAGGSSEYRARSVFAASPFLLVSSRSTSSATGARARRRRGPAPAVRVGRRAGERRPRPTARAGPRRAWSHVSGVASAVLADEPC
jgi:hypothetical protein